ncbi:MAG: hypothetical protein IPQ07_05430 [Myxococcales bacterium]|nr:hypothetical protein [Myxococcales bacterium]
MRRHTSIVVLCFVVLAACKGSKGGAETNGGTGSSAGSGSSTGSGSSAGSGSAMAAPVPKEREPIETTREKMLQDKLERTGEKDGSKGDKNDSEWVPAEFKKGAARWKDIGVYVDGKPIGFLSFGELPITLKPTWVKDKVSAEKRPGTDDPGWRWAQQRFYKFTDYLKAVGIDAAKVKELHVVGPKFSQTTIVTGKDLKSKASDEFMFRFGGNTFGKAIPHSLSTFGNGKVPDKIAGVMIYITKKPPTLVRNEGLFLDGVEQNGVPYYGEPIRGGIRVYLDDKVATIIKRQDLDVSKATKSADGELHWKLVDVLTAQGVVLDKARELWVIRDELRQDKPFSATELPNITFTASSQAKGGIMISLGDKSLRANALALHTRVLDPAEIPVVTADD